MKRMIWCILSLVIASSLAACSKTQELVVEDTGIPQKSELSVQDVLNGNQPFYYVSAGESDFTLVNIAEAPSLFKPNDDYTAIQKYAMVDLDGDGTEEAVIFVCGATGDTGGYLVLNGNGNNVYGYQTDYRTFENLKADGTFFYSDAAGTKEGVATIGFTQSGFVMTDILSATGQAYMMDNYMINGKKATDEEYNSEKEKQDLKNNVGWHEFSLTEP